MTRPSWTAINFITYLLLVYLAVSVQTSLLHWVFGWHATVQIVIVLVTYICLYRDGPEALLFTVLACYGAGLASTMYSSISVFSGVCLFLALRTLRKQVYSSSPVYFTWTALSCVLGFHLISWLATVIFDHKKIRPNVLEWILEILITALFARLLYRFCIWVDKKTKRLTLSELNS